jgi:hypothetical protein
LRDSSALVPTLAIAALVKPSVTNFMMSALALPAAAISAARRAT